MAFDNLASAFQSGKQAAVQTPFEYGAGNVMDLFKMQQENAMKLAQTAALFQGEKQYEYQTDPTKVGAQRQLNELNGFSGGGSGVASNPMPSSPNSGGSPTPNPIQQGALNNGMVQTGTDIMGHKFENQGAAVTKDVIQKQLESSSSDAAGAALMLQKMDELKNLHDRALKASGIDRAKVQQSPFGLATRASQATQSAQLSMQGPDNPDWQNYENAKKNFAMMADRGLFGEKGKLTGQQIAAGNMLFPGKGGTQEGDEGLWNILYSVPKQTIDFHNQLVAKNLGSNSPAQIQSNPIQSAAAAQQNSSTNKIDPAQKENDRVEIKKRLASGKYEKTKAKMIADFKNEYGEDL